MSKKLIVGSRVSILAKVSKITLDKNRNRVVVLEDVSVDGEYFRCHSWVKLTRRLEHPSNIDRKLKDGDTISATAEVSEYIDSSDLSNRKIGFKTFRNVRIVE